MDGVTDRGGTNRQREIWKNDQWTCLDVNGQTCGWSMDRCMDGQRKDLWVEMDRWMDGVKIREMDCRLRYSHPNRDINNPASLRAIYLSIGDR